MAFMRLENGREKSRNSCKKTIEERRFLERASHGEEFGEYCRDELLMSFLCF
jgi:hypothetical protein